MKKTARKSAREVTPVVQDLSGAALTYGGLLFLSGVAALVYQVLWVRQLSLVVGIEVYSITVAVSAFFAGLAAGGAVFGRMADRVASAIRLYAGLEIAVALSASGMATCSIGWPACSWKIASDCQVIPASAMPRIRKSGVWR